MNKLLLCLVLCSVHINSWSQSTFKVYHEYKLAEALRIFQMGHKIMPDKKIMNDGRGKLYYENPDATNETMRKSAPVNMIIRIADLNGDIVQDLEIHHNDVDIDLSGFLIHYLGSRKFLVFSVGRYSFYLLNVSTHKLVGPLQSGVEGEASDSQDGTISMKEVFHNGQYLIGYAQGFGMFCYNLMDLYNPVPVDHLCTEQTHLHKTYFFLDHRINNIYNGLVIENDPSGAYDLAKFLFQGVKLRLDENGQLLQEIIDDTYVQYQKIEHDGQTSSFTIDFNDGIIQH